MSGDRKLGALLEAVDQLKRAFGAPGDYGYGTKEGDALFALYKARAEFPHGAMTTIIDTLRRARQFIQDHKALIIESHSHLNQDLLPIAGTLDTDAAEEIAAQLDPLLAEIDAAVAMLEVS